MGGNKWKTQPKPADANFAIDQIRTSAIVLVVLVHKTAALPYAIISNIYVSV